MTLYFGSVDSLFLQKLNSSFCSGQVKKERKKLEKIPEIVEQDTNQIGGNGGVLYNCSALLLLLQKLLYRYWRHTFPPASVNRPFALSSSAVTTHAIQAIVLKSR